MNSIFRSQTERYTIILLRHGESTGNAENIHQGQCDFPLSPTGRRQAQALAERWLAEGVVFDRVIASPLRRAQETAEIIAAALQAPIEFDPDWLERHFGQLSGMKAAEARRRYPPPPFMNPYTRFGETGESRWDVYLRAGGAVQALLRRPPGRYLVVAHGAVLNMAILAILGLVPQANNSGARFALGNTGFATFIYHPGEHAWNMRAFNDQAHCEEEGTQFASAALQAETEASPPCPPIYPVRLATLNDLEEIVEVILEADELHVQALARVYQRPDDFVTIRRNHLADLLQRPENRLFVAEKDGQMAGAAVATLREAPTNPLHTPRRYVIVDTLSVRQASRRQGVGQALMEGVHAWGREMGAAQVELTVWEFNRGAIAFYEQLGYTLASRRMWIDL